MERSKKSILAIVLGVIICVGVVSQIVERNLNKDEIKTFVSTNLKEDDKHQDERFDFSDEDENSLLEWIGF